jgi:hypothetical protein
MSELHRAYCFPLFSGSDGLFTIRDGGWVARCAIHATAMKTMTIARNRIVIKFHDG